LTRDSVSARFYRLRCATALTAGLFFTLVYPGISPLLGAEVIDMRKLEEMSRVPGRQPTCLDKCCTVPGTYVSFDVLFNTKDAFLGFALGQALVGKREFELRADYFFYGRPFEKSSFEQTGPTSYRQYREKRYITGVRIIPRLRLSDDLGIFGGAGYGYTFGSFNGTERPTRDHWTKVFIGGAALSLAVSVSLEGGYQYMKIPHSPDHFIFSSMSFNYTSIVGPGNTPGTSRPVKDGKKKSNNDGAGPKESRGYDENR